MDGKSFEEWDRERSLEEEQMSRKKFLGAAAGAVGGASIVAGALGAASAGASGLRSELLDGTKPFVIADWGGNTAQVRLRTWGAAFTRLTHVPVAETAIDYGKFISQIQAKKVSWNWIDAEGWFVFAHPDLLVNLPYHKMGITKRDVYPIKNAYLPKALLSYHSTYAIGYRTDTKLTVPNNWVQFFDTKNFPGKRALYNWPYGTLEIALLADGVPYDKLYPLDLQRAFKKIDSIKPDLVWWNSGAESQQFLVSGSADFVQAWHNRVAYLAVGGLPIALKWGQNLQILTHHLISKYQPRPNLCADFIKASYEPKAMAAYATESLNSPPGPASYKLLDSKTKAWMSTSPAVMRQSVGPINDAWWGKNLDSVSKQWYAWVNH